MNTLKEKFNALSKESKQNVIIMFCLILMFIIGIIIRWDYISTEIEGSVNRYVEVFHPDSLKKK